MIKGQTMSYVRWSGPEGPHNYHSDLYIYDDVNGGITCLGCDMNSTDNDGNFNCATHNEMIAHVKEHIIRGHAVPEFVIERLKTRRNFN